MKTRFTLCLSWLLIVVLGGCDSRTAWNNPHGDSEDDKKILYTVFTSPPKHLDPVRTYNLDEATFIDQIYEPPLEYHYLKRPYELQPLTLTKMPEVSYFTRWEKVEGRSQNVEYSRYDFEIKPGIYYQPHPAFAKNNQGEPFYQFAHAHESKAFKTLEDFTERDTKELVAADYIYQIKRMADPTLQLPIWDLLSRYIVGLEELREDIQALRAEYPDSWIKLDDFLLTGVEQHDRYRFSITLKGRYPQFKYWLAFHFFAPVPMEVDRFYHLPGLPEKNITLNVYPVGTGPYMMSKINPREEIVLERNPHYQRDVYPSEGEAADVEKGLLKDAGKALPLIDKVIFRRESEAIPVWTKFLQGYYDRSGISSDSFDQAVSVNVDGIGLSEGMQARGVQLNTSIEPATYYLGFNMLDATVGGLTDKQKKLRQAIAIAYDEEEQIAIFRNGRGEEAMSPLPPGIFGYQPGKDGFNPQVFDWVETPKGGQAQRKSIEVARQLLAEAGYPEGRHEKSGEPLVLNLDTTTGGSTDNARNTWLIRQFAKLGIQLNIRATDYNRFQDKMENGNAQIFFWGWFADYPDPENFLFLLYGPNGRVGSGGSGVNSSNYANPEYDALFNQMKNLEDSPQRLAYIQKMLTIVRQDTPWASSFHPQSFVLSHGWMQNFKPHGISQATLKYQNIDTELRAQKRQEWNRPVLWPVVLLVILLTGMAVPGYRAYRARQAKRIRVGESA